MRPSLEKYFPYLNKHKGKVRIPRSRTNINSRTSKNKQPEITGKEVSIRQNDAPAQFVYGRARIGGVLSFVHNVESGGYLHIVITLTRGLIDGVEYVYIGEDKLTFYSPPVGWANGGVFEVATTSSPRPQYKDKIFVAQALGGEDQTAIGDLVAQSAALFPGKWTDAHRQRGWSHVYMILEFNNQTFPDGFPEISFIVRGRPVYDPRSDTTYFSGNAALCLADYLTDTHIGLGIPYSRLDEDNLIEAANICDQHIDLLQGGWEPRYNIDAIFQTDETRKDILEKMVGAMAGCITEENGKIKLWPGAWRSPVVDLTEDDLRSDVSIRVLPSKRDNFNAVRGEHVDPEKKWQIADFPPYSNEFYKTQDGGEQVFFDATYPLTISRVGCQRLAKIDLERIRQPIEVTASWSLKAFKAEVPENVTLTLPRYGWSGKAFEVVESELALQSGQDAPELTVELQLRETASGVFDWNMGLETQVDLSQNTNLPDPFSVPALTGLALASGTDNLYIRADGTVFTRIRVSWTPFLNTFISSGGFVEIQYKPSAASDWIPSTPVQAENSFTFILDVQDGVRYDVRARARNAVGIVGTWSTVLNHLVIGKTAPPSDVENFTGQISGFEVRFFWDAVPDLDISHYEIRSTDETLSWSAGEFVAEVRGTQYVLTMRRTNVYYYLIKAVDTSGNYSLHAAALSVNVQGPAAVTITHSIVGENVRLQWTPAVSQHSVEEYEVRYGLAYDLSILIATIKGTALNIKGGWSGLRRFWVTGFDVAGNRGTPAFRDVYIYPPFAVTVLTARVIDNNVLLQWSASVGGTLPVDGYYVYKGPILDSAELIGAHKGTFAAVFESYSGDYVYWVVPFDTAGNLGQGTQVGARVDEPPDFELLDDVILDPADADTLDNIRAELVPEPPDILPEAPLPGTSAPGEVFGMSLMGLTYPRAH